jgi:hypothetical protein
MSLGWAFCHSIVGEMPQARYPFKTLLPLERFDVSPRSYQSLLELGKGIAGYGRNHWGMVMLVTCTESHPELPRRADHKSW